MFHTFAICAYQESPYLERCIRSLKEQSVPAHIILCTSTPNAFLEDLAARYHLPVYVREGKSDIREDWNFAYNKAKSDYVTIAHQDDVYHRDYLKCLQKQLKRRPDTLLAVTDYRILDGRGRARGDASLLVKKILKLPLLVPTFADKNWAKRFALAFGNSICCPCVCYHKKRLGEDIFQKGYRYALDWETFRVISERPGRFLYVSRTLFYYRIHGENTTKKCLENREKTKEEMEMFQKFWPDFMARALMRLYRLSYRNYRK